MRNLVFIFFIFFFNCCSHKISKEKANNLEYSNGKQKIVLEIMTGDNFLKFDNPTKIKVKFDNILGEKLSFSGQNIKFIKAFNEIENEIILEVNLKNNENKLEYFSLLVSYKMDNESFFHKFKIPVK